MSNFKPIDRLKTLHDIKVEGASFDVDGKGHTYFKSEMRIPLNYTDVENGPSEKFLSLFLVFESSVLEDRINKVREENNSRLENRVVLSVIIIAIVVLLVLIFVLRYILEGISQPIVNLIQKTMFL